MSKIDLSQLNLDELKALEKDVAKAIVEYTERKRQEALNAAKAAAEKAGFSLAELMAVAKRPQKAPARYQHPENPALTWSGRGRRPAWFVEAVEGGKTPEELEIS